MRIISIFLALINSLLAGLLITFLLTSVDFQFSTIWWSAVRILLALSIIVIGVLSWIEMMMPVRPGILALGSLFLVAIGPATMMWAFQQRLPDRSHGILHAHIWGQFVCPGMFAPAGELTRSGQSFQGLSGW